MSPLIRNTPMKRGSKPLKRVKLAKSNPERQKKAKARYAKKLAAYKRSETYALVEARSGGRCEMLYQTSSTNGGYGAFARSVECIVRCIEAARHHHHTTYARFGGRELPDDIVHVCPRCHDRLESQKPAGNRRSRA